jgi:hypothetical protein
MLHLRPVAQITGLDIDADVVGHLGPPVLMGYELRSFEAACMSSDVCIVVLLDNMTLSGDTGSISASDWPRLP